MYIYYKRCKYHVSRTYMISTRYIHTWCMICTHDVWYIHMIYHLYTWCMIYVCIYSVLHYSMVYMYMHVYHSKNTKKTTRQNCSLLIGGLVLLFYSSLVEHWPTLLENATQYATLSLCGGFLKWWYPATMGFPSKNDHFEVFWGTTI